ncbi:MAG: hypothetical protein DMF66_18620, partial [Acidobacteria bacterium]
MFLRPGRAPLPSLYCKRPRFALCAVLLAALCSTAARAQVGTDDTGTGGKHIIQGRIIFPSGQR